MLNCVLIIIIIIIITDFISHLTNCKCYRHPLRRAALTQLTIYSTSGLPAEGRLLLAPAALVKKHPVAQFTINS